MEKLREASNECQPKCLVEQFIRFALMTTFCIVIVLLISYTNVNYIGKQGYATQNIPKFLIAVVCMLGIAIYAILCPGKKSMPWKKRVYTFSIVLLMVQLYILFNIYFFTGWDPRLVYYLADLLTRGEETSGWYVDYFSRYQNNILISLIEAWLLKLNDVAGILPETHESMVMGIMNCFIMFFTCYQTYCLLLDYTKSERCALLGYTLSVLLIGLSPWMVVGYTDTLGLLFPTLILKVYSMHTEQKECLVWLKWFAMIGLAAIGFFIKPQCIIVFIAICAITCMKKLSLRSFLNTIGVVLAFVLVFISVDAAINVTAQKSGIILDNEKAFGWQHMLMMGLNYETNGVYSDEDVDFSASFETRAERNQNNLVVAKERLLGLQTNLADHLAKKMLILFNDGMFAWGGEGDFYNTVYEEPNSFVAPWLRSILYSTGSSYQTYASFIHTIWLGVILLVLTGCLVDKKQFSEKSILRLSIIGLVLFEMLFEVRARYLFTYVPYLIILAVDGLYSIKTITREKLMLWAVSKTVTEVDKH